VVGACLDVSEYEATSFENMNIKDMPAPMQYLLASDNVILTPHIAGWTHESNYKMSYYLAEKILATFHS
jgi:D-3-phosphoglycerate dehydrogenase